MSAPTPQSEAEVQAAILRALGQRRDLKIFRRNVTVSRDLTGRVIRSGIPGEADLEVLLAPLGSYLGLEVKSATGRQSPEQQVWQRTVEALGGAYAVVRSVEEAEKAVQSAQAEIARRARESR